MYLIRNLILPLKRNVPSINKPKDHVTIALHARKGSHGDLRFTGPSNIVNNLNIKIEKDPSHPLFRKGYFSNPYYPLICSRPILYRCD